MRGNIICVYKESRELVMEKSITLLHSERPKFYAILALVSAIGLKYAVIN